MSDDPKPLEPSLRILGDKLRERWGEGDDMDPTSDSHGSQCHKGIILQEDGTAVLCQECMAGRREAMWGARIPSRYRWACLDDFDGTEGSEALGSWPVEPQGRNLVVFGPIGCGKSHLAVAACRDAHEHGLEVRFLPEGELLDLLRPGGSATLSELADVDRLIIDDLGTDRQTEWGQSQLYTLINRRWLEEAPTVVTTNVPPGEMSKVLGERLFSRLVGSDAVVIRLSGADRRRRA